MRFIEFPKFHIEAHEFKITKTKLKKFLGVGLTAVGGYYLYTKGIDKIVINLLNSIPILNELLQFTLVKVFVISVALYYIKNIID